MSLMIIFLFGSCARKIAFQTSSVVPAAEGTVKVKKDNNNNYTIDIEVSNLAEPGRLLPAMKTYVVWMDSDQDKFKNIGQINSSTSFLSNKLKASFETVSSNKPTKIFITAEDDGNVQYPGTQVLTTASF
jgi:hypothetical protein